MNDKTFETNVLERLARIESRLNNGIVEIQKDHEKRIRFLEKFFLILAGIVGLKEILFRILNIY